MSPDEFPARTSDSDLESEALESASKAPADPLESDAADLWGETLEENSGDRLEDNATTISLTDAVQQEENSQSQAADEALSESEAESKQKPLNLSLSQQPADLEQRIAQLQQQEQELKQAIATLQSNYHQTLERQTAEAQAMLSRLVKEGLSDLERRKQTLRIEVEQLERRQDRVRSEMRRSFAGVSQDLAIRVQGFKDYLVGSLQDLAVAAEQLELVPSMEAPMASPAPDRADVEAPAVAPQRTDDRFQDQDRRIRALLDQYRTRPDYYGSPWQLRRTFEPIHAERVANWFFEQGGRGAVRSMGSRLQNTLVASAVISVLKNLYDERLQTLVLIDSPERLGEWRRGLQDCLGISRTEFGSDRGVILFEAPEPLAQRAERLVQSGKLPLIIIDESEAQVSLAVLQFPLWLAFAPDPRMPLSAPAYGSTY